MKPLPFQTPKPSSTRSRSKETPHSKRSVTGSNDPKILSKSPASNLSELAETDASDSSSSKSKQQKIVPKSLIFEFESASEDLAGSASDPPLLLADLESSVVGQDLTSWISPLPAISSEVVQGGGGSGKIVVSVESPEAVAVTDLLKESILEFKSSAKGLDALRADLDGGERDSGTGRWSDGGVLDEGAGWIVFVSDTDRDGVEFYGGFGRPQQRRVELHWIVSYLSEKRKTVIFDPRENGLRRVRRFIHRT